ncbi:MAG: hypothetical protein HYS08_09720 [Chlamydiae bacterium]|nr:hypothetical protein [Chlamydiota bacterium]
MYIQFVELKASTNVNSTDLRGLKNFAEFYGRTCHLCIAYWGQVEKREDNIFILPWQEVLKKML